MRIKNVRVYGLWESIIRSGYPMQIGEPKDLIYDVEDALTYYDNDDAFGLEIKDLNKANKLANTPIGSGHNNFLKGIIVQFDLQYPEYFSPQLQRYHWIDIVSSQSKMHKLTSVANIKDNCNKYVSKQICNRLNDWIETYNTWDFNKHPSLYLENIIGDTYISDEPITSKEELFQYIISNLPMGYEMWMGISTNYLQLKTIYNQRKNHKLKNDWGYFCNWIETLPMAKELILSK